MGLPTSRDLTLIDGSSRVPASLLNNLQDVAIAHHEGLRDPTWRVHDEDFEAVAALAGTLPTLTSEGALLRDAYYFDVLSGAPKVLYKDSTSEDASGWVDLANADGNACSGEIRGHNMGIYNLKGFRFHTRLKVPDRSKLDTNANRGLRAVFASVMGFQAGSTLSYWQPFWDPTLAGTVNTPTTQIAVASDWQELQIAQDNGLITWSVDGTVIYTQVLASGLSLIAGVAWKGIALAANTPYCSVDFIRWAIET